MSAIGEFLGNFRRQLAQEQFTRARVHDILSASSRQDDYVSRASDLFLITLIVLNVLAVMIDSVSGLTDPVATEMFVFEAVSVFFFSVEYGLRVWTSVETDRFAAHGPVWGRVRYIFSPMALTDLVAIIPFFIVLSGTDLFDLRFLRVMRLRRAFKLTRYSPDMTIVLGVLRDELRPLLALGFVLLLLVIMGSSMIFVLEATNQGPFASIPGAMKWSLENLTTVGNAAVSPSTQAGRVFATILGVFGVIYVSMITGIFAAGFTNARHKRHASLRRFVKIQLVTHGGVLDGDAMDRIDQQRRHMALTAQDALEIINEALEEYAGLDLDKLRDLARRDERMLLED